MTHVQLRDREQCDRGHSLLEPGSLEEFVAGKWRCVECRRHLDRERKRAKRSKPRRRRSQNTIVEAQQGRDQTREILDLCDARERETRAWLKAELTRRIERLRA